MEKPEHKPIHLIKDLCKRNKVFFKSHALIRIVEREIDIDEVLTALKSAEIIKEYSTAKPLPSYLVLGFTTKNNPLHILCAADEKQDALWIITVYEPDPGLWTSDFKRRQK